MDTDLKTPLHLWIVGIVSLLWNAMGAFDYVMTQTRNAEYLSAFSAEQLAFFHGLPDWVVACWAIAVWGSVLGSLLLLLRRRLASPVFLISLLAAVLTFFQNYVLSDGMRVMGDAFSLIFSLVILLVAAALFGYSRSLVQKGILK